MLALARLDWPFLVCILWFAMQMLHGSASTFNCGRPCVLWNPLLFNVVLLVISRTGKTCELLLATVM